jgi:hypothetical protein
MKKIGMILIGVSMLALAACSSPVTAEKALSDMGMTNIKTTGYAFFACGEEYAFHTGFTATNPNGKEVSGAVCSGWLGYASVRFY